MEQIQEKNDLGQFCCHIVTAKQTRLIQPPQGDKREKNTKTERVQKWNNLMFPAGGTMANTNGPELVQEIIMKAATD